MQQQQQKIITLAISSCLIAACDGSGGSPPPEDTDVEGGGSPGGTVVAPDGATGGPDETEGEGGQDGSGNPDAGHTGTGDPPRCDPPAPHDPGDSLAPQGVCRSGDARTTYVACSEAEPLLRPCDDDFLQYCQRQEGTFVESTDVELGSSVYCSDASFLHRPCDVAFDQACADRGGAVLQGDDSHALAFCALPDPGATGFGTIDELTDVNVEDTEGGADVGLSATFTTTTGLEGAFSMTGVEDSGVRVQLALGGEVMLEVFTPSEAFFFEPPGQPPACWPVAQPEVFVAPMEDAELAQLNGLMIDLTEALPAQLGDFTFGVRPQHSFCDTACNAAGAGAGAAAGVGAAGACTGATAGVAAPGCAAGGYAVGAAAGVFVAAGCKGLFC